jgi:signal transduction histidine kinase
MDGVWNEDGKSLKIIIYPPFWATWWFRGCGIILIIGFMGYIRQRKISKIKKEMQIQAEFTKQMIESQEKERKRIAGELHDSLGQNLLIIKNKALMGKKNPGKNQELIDDISELSSSTLEEVREISYNLHPYQLESLGLTRAIESITEKAESSTGIKFENDLDLIDNILNPEAEINVYRIIQECVNNIIKHSDASKVKLEIKRETEKLYVTISDNGKGYNVSAALSGRTKMSLGLMDITERAKLLGGKVTFESIKGKGSRCSITLTIKKN